MPAAYPYTITNSQKGGFFMRTYGRNVRRTWDGDGYHAPKRQRLDTQTPNASIALPGLLGPDGGSTNAYDGEDTLVRAIRETSVAAMSSPPSRRNSTVFSFNETHEAPDVNTLTPPSSPPNLDITPPAIKMRKSTFSAVEKKKQKEKDKMQKAKRKRDEAQHPDAAHPRDDSEPLSEVLNPNPRLLSGAATEQQEDETNLIPSVQCAGRPATTGPTAPKALTQTILDFGQSTTPVTCSQCQMTYTPSVPDDVTLHTMFHDRHNRGIELSKPFLKSAMKWCYEVAHIPGSVVVVDRKISLPARRTVQKVLDVVNKELGSVDVLETELWGQTALEGEGEEAKRVDRYKVFLHVIDGKCVGVCLAERISRAFRVRSVDGSAGPGETSRTGGDTGTGDEALLTPTSTSPTPKTLPSSANIEMGTEPVRAVVGVSRIWTSKSSRRKGIANNLLECVMNQFIYGVGINREDVAFSQPTDMGAALARGWYGETQGWRVYREA